MLPKAISLVIPELNGKLIGSAQRVPTPTGSATILTAVVEGNVTVEQINEAMKAASNESFGYNTDEIVSSDIVGMRYGSLFDATQTMVMPLDNGTTQVQVVSWYDNREMPHKPDGKNNQMLLRALHKISVFHKDSQRVRSNMDRIISY